MRPSNIGTLRTDVVYAFDHDGLDRSSNLVLCSPGLLLSALEFNAANARGRGWRSIHWRWIGLG